MSGLRAVGLVGVGMVVLVVLVIGWSRPINDAVTGDGRLYDARYRRGLWASFHAVIDLGRATDILDGLPGVFSRHASHSIRHTDPNEDRIGKAVPETVIAQLDAHLDLLGVDGNYGRIWSPADTNAWFATAYQVQRHADAGVRAPGSGSASSDQLRSVAVPFGNCIEPSNIKAGGKACPIRFQCAGCGSCRPDPSYLPAIEDHVLAIKAAR